MIRILIVDDQPATRLGLALQLRPEPDLEVVGEAGNGREALELAGRLDRAGTPVDVVLCDVRMPFMDGIEATARLTVAHPGLRVLVLTTFDRDDYAFGALRAGASGFLLKGVEPAELVAAVRSVARGDAVLAPRVTRELIGLADLAVAAGAPSADGSGVNAGTGADAGADPRDRPGSGTRLDASPAERRRAEARAAIETLTPRERELVAAIGEGLTNAEIAEALFLSPASVKTYVVRLLAKLGLRDRVQVVILAYDSGLAPGA